MLTAKQKFGSAGEQAAVKRYVSQGYQVVDRNFRRPWGELDIVAKRGSELVFCEVKTMRALPADKAALAMRPEDQMTAHKLSKFRKAILVYLKEKRLPFDQVWRADVIAIELDSSGQIFDLRHIENILFE